MNRRDFIKGVLAAPIIPAIWSIPGSTPAIAAQCFVPKFLDARPKIEGIFGQTHFRCGEGHWRQSFTIVHAYTKLFLGERDIMAACFEVDLVAGWVGLFWHKWAGIHIASKDARDWNRPRDNTHVLPKLKQVWCYGPLTLRKKTLGTMYPVNFDINIPFPQQ